MFNMSVPSGIVNNRNNLKNYIEDAYETWENPPVHVTIVGDVDGSYDIPTWNESYSGYSGEGICLTLLLREMTFIQKYS